MAKEKLPKYTLVFNEKQANWPLKQDGSGRTVKVFDNKSDAIKGGALEKALGDAGGSVKIQKVDGRIQEERTYPRSEDPKKSKG